MAKTLVSFVFAALPLAAQSSLSLMDAVRIALEKHPSVQASREASKGAEMRIAEVRSGYLPKLNYAESVLRSNNPVVVFSSLLTQHQFAAANFALDTLNRPAAIDDFQSQVTLDQTVYDGGQTRLAVRTAKLGRDLSAADERATRMNAIANVVRAYHGVVRHYYLRRGSNIADIQVNLLNKHERSQQSHEIAKRVRNVLLPVAARWGARIKVAEVPPGPPVLETLVAEVYGPSEQGRIALARQIRDLFKRTDGVVDVDWYVEDDQPKYQLLVDKEKASLSGITEDDIARSMRIASAGETAGLLHVDSEKEDVPITVRLARATRSDLERIQSLKIAGVPLSSLVRARQVIEDKSIYHKNLLPVTYVVADVAGAMESPVYAVLALGPGIHVEQYTSHQPTDDSKYAMKWDGEWHITYEVFRDLGIAFAAVLVLIYVLVVGWFESFVTPLIIMAAIPFSLVGILPAHGLLHAFFTATSMIGFIAGAGIVVRNSIILVDFIELRLRQGSPLQQAVIDAGAVRFRPMLLTACAVVVGAAVILFDPIFQGLAIALMAGEIASLALSRMTVPIVYYMVKNRRNV
jgi:multidrug efflux pump subunit AcrB